MSEVVEKQAAGTRGIPVWLQKIAWPLLALALMLIVATVNVEGFLSVNWVDTPDGAKLAGNPVSILLNATQVALLATGMCLVIATGGIDLSVGAIMAITAAVTVEAINADVPAVVAIAMGLGAAMLCGVWNGVLVAVLGIQPIVATLVLMVAGRGVAQLITDGQIPNFDNATLEFLGQGTIFGLPFPPFLAIGVFALTWLAVRYTSIGLMIETVGDNPITARYVGIPVSLVTLLTYVFSGLCAGLAGLVASALIQSADANNAGLYMELDAIFAVVVGGTALIGGRFYLGGALVGALLLQTLTTTILALEVPSQLLPLPKAIAIVAVILLQSPVLHGHVTRVRKQFARHAGQRTNNPAVDAPEGTGQ